MSEARHALRLHGSQTMSCSYRDAEDDFFCLRYRVWYPSLDCAYRTKFRTAPGCLECEQGRFNLKRHDDVLVSKRIVSNR